MVTAIHGLAADMVMGLAIDDEGQFYVSEIVSDAGLYQLDPESGVTTRIHLDTVINAIHGLEFMPELPRTRAYHGEDVD